MPKVSDIYSQANYLTAADITKPITTKIGGVTVEAMKDGKRKIVVLLEGVAKSLVLNKTNASTLSSRFGDDFEKWVGEEVTLASVPTTFQGQNVKGLRVL